MNSARTDIHRPSAINVEEYDFVCIRYSGDDADAEDAYSNQLAAETLKAHMGATEGAFSNHAHGGSCHICGAWANTVAYFHHLPTNQYIITGEDCCEKIEAGHSLAFRSLRKECNEHVVAKAGKRRAKAFLANIGLEAAYPIYDAHVQTEYEEQTIRDIVCKLVRYGSISEPQIKLLTKLLNDISAREDTAAAKQAEHDAASPLPKFKGRTRIKVTILAVKEVESEYGFSIKILGQHADGWKVWGSLPRGIEQEKGLVIAFDARIEPSDKDSKFGFFSRPTKAAVVVDEALL